MNNFEEPLKRILVFGGSGHIGGPLTSYLVAHAPGVELVLATSSENKVGVLQTQFPTASVVVCNYMDIAQMDRAFEGVDGVYMITPDFTDEVTATTNLVNASKAAGCWLLVPCGIS